MPTVPDTYYETQLVQKYCRLQLGIFDEIVKANDAEAIRYLHNLSHTNPTPNCVKSFCVPCIIIDAAKVGSLDIIKALYQLNTNPYSKHLSEDCSGWKAIDYAEGHNQQNGSFCAIFYGLHWS